MAYSTDSPRVNLFLIGVNKAGSSWLYYLLDSHPAVFMSAVKELYFFDSDYPENLERYLRHFDFESEYQYWGEATPTYYRQKSTAENIYDYNPNAKVLFIVRDPIQRLYSQFYFHKQLDLIPEEMSLEDALDNDPHLIADSHYESTIPVYENLFGGAQCMIVSLEEAKQHEERVWAEIQSFLHLPKAPFPEERGQSENATGSRLFRAIYRVTIRPVKVFIPGVYKWLLQRSFMRWTKTGLLQIFGTAQKEPISPEIRESLEKEFAPTYQFLQENDLLISETSDSIKPGRSNPYG